MKRPPRHKNAAAAGGRPDLPDFAKPPLAEVVLSIQFATLERLKSIHMGLLWDRIRSTYPAASELAALAPTFETFGAPTLSAQGIQFEQLLAPPMPRYWFEKIGDPHLFQVQQDRIVHNWRKRESDHIYPRYEFIRDRLKQDVEEFRTLLAEESLGEMRPNQCEVTYVNILQIPGVDQTYKHLSELTPLWGGELGDEIDAEFENATVQMRFRLNNKEGKPTGRVHVAFQPVVLQADSSKQAIKLDITARGRPPEETIESAFEFLEASRGAVVKTFAAVTTPSMHKLWERTDARRS